MQPAPESASPHDFVSPQASPAARMMIAKGRQIIFDPKMKQAVHSAIAGTKDLATGIATYVTYLVSKLEEKMGQLNDQDFQQVIAHLCGTMVEVAQQMGEPTAQQNSSGIVKQAIQAAMQMHQQGGQGDPSQQQGSPQAPDPSQQPPQGGSPMGQFSPPQGPPQ